MTDHLIVPVDGSESSWRAFDVAIELARVCDGRVDVVQVVSDPTAVARIDSEMSRHVAERGVTDVAVDVSVVLGADVVGKLTELVVADEGATIVMASHGRGRSAALLGSTAEELLQRSFGPLLVVGPHAKVPDFTKRIVVAVDGSECSEHAVPLAAAWAIELHSEPWLIEVIEPDLAMPSDVTESAYASRLAHKTEAVSGRTVQYEVLHHRSPVDAIKQYAEVNDAALIVAGTHGRTGARRLVLGSVASGFVKYAPCPVLLVRPPHLPTSGSDDE